MTPLQRQAVAHVRPVLIVLVGTVGFVLLIACANVANLLMVRTASKEKEMAVRRALGSGRVRIARQMFTESLVLALLGAGAGIVLSSVGVDVLLTMMPESLPRAETIALDGWVLAFTLAVSAVAALLFGMAPFLQSSRANPAGILHERIATGSRKRRRVRSALTVVLLVGAGLLLRRFTGLASVDSGFQDDDILSFRFALPVFEYRNGEMMRDFFFELSQSLDQMPQVQSAGAVMPLPLTDQADGQIAGYTRNRNDEEDFRHHEADYRAVLPGYFETIRISILAGRVFDYVDEENADADPVIVIDRLMAEEAFPGENPIGQEVTIWVPGRFQTPSGIRPARVIGVVESVRSGDLTSLGRPAIYHPYNYTQSYRLDYVVRSSAPSAPLIAQIRQAVREAGANVPILDLRPLSDYSRDALAPTRFAMTLMGVFAAVALVLACIGLYGVLSFNVRERTHEVGIRMALGAAADVVLRMVIAQGLRLVVIGVVLGLIGAVALGDVMTNLLFGVSPTDPVTYVGIAGVLVAVAVAACYVPAARATRVQPAVALRAE